MGACHGWCCAHYDQTWLLVTGATGGAQVKRIMMQLRKHGRVLRPYIGLKFVELNPTISADLRQRAAEHLQSPGSHDVPDAGLYVMHVAPSSPAQRGGIKVGDTISGVDDVPIRSTRELVDALSAQVGGQVQLRVQRQQTSVTATLTIESLRQ